MIKSTISLKIWPIGTIRALEGGPLMPLVNFKKTYMSTVDLKKRFMSPVDFKKCFMSPVDCEKGPCHQSL
jgi:hypothetical protein